MADIVGSLFGLSVPELEAQRRRTQLVEDQNYATMLSRGSVAPGRTYNQALVGRSLGNALGNALFGVKDPAIERASNIDSVVKGVFSSIPEEQRGSKSLVFSKLAEAFAQNPDTQKEAIQAVMQAAQFKQEEEASGVNLAYKTSLTNANLDAQDRKNVSLAYNAGYGLKSLLDSNVPLDKFELAFQGTVNKLKEKGFDTSYLEQAENPEEKAAAVDYLISLGTSEKTRSSSAIADKKAAISERLAQYKKESDAIKQKLMSRGLDIKESEGLKNRAAALDRAIITAEGVGNRLAVSEENIRTREKLSERSKEIETLDSEYQTQLDIKDLQDTFDLPMDKAKISVKDYQSKLKDLLNEKDQYGSPLHSLTSARELAKQYISSGVKKSTGYFSKPSYKSPSTGAKEQLPVEARNLLKEGLKTTFGNGQVWTLSNGNPTRVK